MELLGNGIAVLSDMKFGRCDKHVGGCEAFCKLLIGGMQVFNLDIDVVKGCHLGAKVRQAIRSADGNGAEGLLDDVDISEDE